MVNCSDYVLMRRLGNDYIASTPRTLHTFYNILVGAVLYGHLYAGQNSVCELRDELSMIMGMITPQIMVTNMMKVDTKNGNVPHHRTAQSILLGQMTMGCRKPVTSMAKFTRNTYFSKAILNLNVSTSKQLR